MEPNELKRNVLKDEEVRVTVKEPSGFGDGMDGNEKTGEMDEWRKRSQHSKGAFHTDIGGRSTHPTHNRFYIEMTKWCVIEPIDR